jgi:N-acetyl-1-D-myo-inositol-2-amino-2-deoxy-alpha-D-glucopyranoside deacetylase
MKTLVAIFAHPDDESFGIGGTLAKYSREAANTYYVCATRGESGTVDAEELQGHNTIGELRTSELECASKELGLQRVEYLNYRDSGMLGSEDNRHANSLFAAAMDEVAQRIIQQIQMLKPDVIITHDQFGGYGHPDHIKLHQATLRAYELMYGMKLATNDRGLTVITDEASNPGVAVPRLYVTAMSRRFLKLAVRLLPLFGQDPHKFGRNQDIDLVQISSWFVPITAAIDVRPYLPDKERASACHHSQRPPAQQGNFITALAFRRSEQTETFARLYPPIKRGERTETSLFG